MKKCYRKQLFFLCYHPKNSKCGFCNVFDLLTQHFFGQTKNIFRCVSIELTIKTFAVLDRWLCTSKSIGQSIF